ncbi:MAG: hypothetical protein A2X67_10045 [Ignavibacteria bacterium GWA2_55_11]|nr:MAG: hypothetical protein A2X67_10045 [Ignavibacteria bacterium GWA2_55_11]OGU45439.1 MAG: hypothetical protein A2X68_00625 [Ignavibacteria bacterium GWC2_56_12]OGU65993.1 MAG: hypothetical protein A3C56_00680 [Ignavibacteria bacterium RIFCSPHIGHO2_02_FULL_56_12]OGU70947.1 MAG: hypothetical protein A3H45_12380 [Ignavibacteria bacterium RIFCSPLOWO2_02_FULL_55_14]OGU76554.1 MAG: hypothetical protein A3G43_04510 [Ignavibacteria bacterium RIFCSPLOWO2_12_FULL_56_21]
MVPERRTGFEIQVDNSSVSEGILDTAQAYPLQRQDNFIRGRSASCGSPFHVTSSAPIHLLLLHVRSTFGM